MPAGWEIMKGEMGGEDLVPHVPDSELPEHEQLASVPEQVRRAVRQRVQARLASVADGVFNIATGHTWTGE